MSLCDFTGDPGLYLPVSRQFRPHPRIPATIQNQAIPVSTAGPGSYSLQAADRGVNNTQHLLLPWMGKSFLLRPCLFHTCCSLLPRARAHRDLFNVFFCLVLRRIPCCKASCQYSLYWDCSFCPNITLPQESQARGQFNWSTPLSTGAV